MVVPTLILHSNYWNCTSNEHNCCDKFASAVLYLLALWHCLQLYSIVYLARLDIVLSFFPDFYEQTDLLAKTHSGYHQAGGDLVNLLYPHVHSLIQTQCLHDKHIVSNFLWECLFIYYNQCGWVSVQQCVTGHWLTSLV